MSIDITDPKVQASALSAQALQRARKYLDKIEANGSLVLAETALLACAAAFDAGWYARSYDETGVNPLVPEGQG